MCVCVCVFQNSLPTLSEQIKKELWESRKHLSQCVGGPPIDNLQRKGFLVDVSQQESARHNRPSSGKSCDYDCHSRPFLMLFFYFMIVLNCQK